MFCFVDGRDYDPTDFDFHKVDVLFCFVDGRDYDPTDFDFHKVDADEARKDAIAQKEGFDPNNFSSEYEPLVNRVCLCLLKKKKQNLVYYKLVLKVFLKLGSCT